MPENDCCAKGDNQRALPREKSKILEWEGEKDGWGTWTRTRTSGVRVRGSTINLFPSGGMFGVIF